MTKEQLSATVQIISTPISLIVFAILISENFGKPVSEYVFGWPILWATVAGILTAIISSTLIAGIKHVDFKNQIKDERDKRINSLSEYYTMGFYVFGGLIAMLFAIYELDYFWIALVLFLSFASASLVASIAKLFMYRFGIFE
jgi:hypothetical protein